MLLSASTTAAEQNVWQYDISIDGPFVKATFICGDPCDVDERQLVGHHDDQADDQSSKQKAKNDASSSATQREFAQRGVKCSGNCGKAEKGAVIAFSPGKDLQEGFTLSIKEGAAHFIFYSVTETEKGPATLRQHSQFRIDRALIELELHDNDVEIRRHSDSVE